MYELALFELRNIRKLSMVAYRKVLFENSGSCVPEFYLMQSSVYIYICVTLN